MSIIRNIILNKNQIKEIIREYQLGILGTNLSREYNISNNTIYKILRENRIPVRRRSKLTKKQSVKVIKEYKAGERQAKKKVTKKEN
ncbi:unnamed protein product [marine sediment metagenome]|uniref:Resolvase HTH domain-containing protein n=1 Tax=marine sediment metagenome TaxID=412755 RepID=X0YEF9_9ZZZZ